MRIAKWGITFHSVNLLLFLSITVIGFSHIQPTGKKFATLLTANTFRFPMDNGYQILREFDVPVPVDNCGPRHNGVDYDVSPGATVRAIANGIVRKAAYNPSGYGNYIVIEHTLPGGANIYSLYAHLESIDANIAEEASVTIGQVIGKEGKTGDGANNVYHLHFELRQYSFNPNIDKCGTYTSTNLQSRFKDPEAFIDAHLTSTGIKDIRIDNSWWYTFSTCDSGDITVALDGEELFNVSTSGWPGGSRTRFLPSGLYTQKTVFSNTINDKEPDIELRLYNPIVPIACAGGSSTLPPPPLPNEPQPPSGSTPPPPSVDDNSAFVSDISLPDDTVLQPSEVFTKTWRLANSGTASWGNGYQLAFVRGTQMGAPSAVNIPDTAPGNTADISINMTAPTQDGTYTGYWQLRNSQGVYFGPEVYVRIRVEGNPVTGPDVPSANGIQFVNASYPTVVTPGQSFRPSVTIKLLNGELYGVNTRGDMLRYKSGGSFGAFPHVAVENTVHTGEQYTFNFYQDMVAPSSVGAYDSVWQIWAAGGWIGPEIHIAFQVQNNPNRAPNVPLPQSPDNWYVSRDGGTPALCAQSNGDLDGDTITQYQFVIYESAQNWDSGWIDSNCVTPSGLGYHGYKWHVRVKDSKGAVSDWSESWNFNIESGDVTITNIHFDISSPSDSESVRVFAATNGCGGTNIGLRVLINTASDGTTNGEWKIIYELGVPILTEENAPYWDTRPYDDGVHLVRVLAKGCTDATWEDGSFLDVPYTLLHRKPSWPPPQTPVNNAWLSTREVLFHWDPALRANNYHLWVSFNPNPEVSPLIDESLNSDVLSYLYNFGQDYDEIYWKVRAINELGDNESVTYKFGIDLVPPTTSIEPMQDATYQSSFVIHWSGSDISSGLRWYDVQVRDTLQTDWQSLRDATTETTMIFTGLPGHQYCFRTRGLDVAGNWEEYPIGDGDQCITIDLTTKPAQEWWDPAYQYQRDLVILNNDGGAMPVGYPIKLVFNQNTNPTADQIYNTSASTTKGDDVRIVYDGVEIPRFLKIFTTSQIEIWFNTQAIIDGLGSDNTHYQMYYGNPSAFSPGFGVNDIFFPKKDGSTVGLWHFQEGSGTNILDNSGNGRNGSVVGNPQWMFGPYGYYLNFNRLSPYYGDYINLGSINLDNFTLEAWINLHNLDVGGDIISKWGGTGNNSYNFAIWNRRLGIQLSGPGGNRELQSQSIQPAVDQWQHVAATYNGNYIRLYINGNLVAEKSDSGGVYSTSTSTVVGRSNDGSNGTWYFQGGISHVAISNVAKTSFPYNSLPGITNIPSVQASQQTTYEPPIIGNADLVVDNVAVYQLPLDQSGNILIEVTLTNQGNAPTQNGFFTDIYLNYVPTGAGDHNNNLHLWVAEAIDPGETITLTTTLNELPSQQSSMVGTENVSSIPENTGIIYAQTDSTGIVSETDNSNNIFDTGANVCIASEDTFESDNTPSSAKTIQTGQTQEHNFSHPEDVDWVKFNAQAGTTYRISTSDLGISSDTYLYLYDTDGTTLITSNDDYNDSLASQIEWTAIQNGIFYVLVKHWNPNVGGCGTGYSMSLSEVLPNLPNSFGKTSPANGAVNQPLSLTINWNTSTRVTSYEYCYDTTDDGNCSNWTNSGNSTSANLNSLFLNTTYYWHVRAINTGGTTYSDGSETAFWSFMTLPTQSITLTPGWNMVSFSIHPLNTDITNVLSSVSGNYDLVYAWDATGAHSGSGNWLKHDNIPVSPDSLTTLDETTGFWIHMTTADTLEIVGTMPISTSITLWDNTGGWNLVGYPSAINRSLPAALQNNGVGTDFSLVYAYHNNDVIDPWKLFDITAPPFVNDLSQVSPGWGYWVKVSTDHTWVIPYSTP